MRMNSSINICPTKLYKNEVSTKLEQDRKNDITSNNRHQHQHQRHQQLQNHNNVHEHIAGIDNDNRNKTNRNDHNGNGSDHDGSDNISSSINKEHYQINLNSNFNEKHQLTCPLIAQGSVSARPWDIAVGWMARTGLRWGSSWAW